jgi:hypothetical protein
MNFNSAYGNKILGDNLENSSYNGRVDILSNENPKIKIDMMEKIASKNKAISYCDAMKGQWEDNSLSQGFFCKENIQIIQNAIRAGVYEKSGKKFVVAPPNMDNLMIIMRSYFLGYVEFYDKDITKQIEYLNNIVIDYCVKELYSASQAYVNYLQDQSSMYRTIPRELQHDRNYKTLQLKDWF